MGLLDHELEKLAVLKEIRDALRLLLEGKQDPPRKLYSKKEIADRLNITVKTVENKIKRGEWTAYYITDDIPRLAIEEVEGRVPTRKKYKPPKGQSRIAQLLHG
jgi:hypothetical protein